jgi:hypothetical protein
VVNAASAKGNFLYSSQHLSDKGTILREFWAYFVERKVVCCGGNQGMDQQPQQNMTYRVSLAESFQGPLQQLRQII